MLLLYTNKKSLEATRLNFWKCWNKNETLRVTNILSYRIFLLDQNCYHSASPDQRLLIRAYLRTVYPNLCAQKLENNVSVILTVSKCGVQADMQGDAAEWHTSGYRKTNNQKSAWGKKNKWHRLKFMSRM